MEFFLDLFSSDLYISFLISSIITLPNILPNFIFLIRNRNSVPLMTYLLNLVLSIGTPFFFVNPIISFVCIGIYYFFFIIPFDYCFCSTSFHGNHSVIRELLHGNANKQTLINILQTNRKTPPSFVCHATAYHYETRYQTYTTTDSEGHTHVETRTYQEMVITWTGSSEYFYESWEEKGNPIRISDFEVIHCVSKVKYYFDASAKNAMRRVENDLLEIARRHDVFQSSSWKYSVPGFVEKVGAYTTEQPSCLYLFYTSRFGVFLWFIMSFIGFQSLYESFWASHGERMVLTLKKSVSSQKVYRCSKGSLDTTAAEATIRFDQPILPPGRWGWWNSPPEPSYQPSPLSSSLAPNITPPPSYD